MPQARDYAEIIARNVLSGKNACRTLENAVAAADPQYFTTAAMPVVEALLGQLAQEQSQRAQLSIQNEKLRFALESLVQNLHRPHGVTDHVVLQLDQFIRKAAEGALDRQITWP